MERIDRLILKAQGKAEIRPAPWELAMKENPYVGYDRSVLIELLSASREDWRQIVQAIVWR
ncbi:hypothetical protein [Catenibacillus scindens]|uniref:hypothetical protein n=1 Tax=Catenibacillus scindens TaxID=673271 RepID=UPI00320A5CB9